MIEYYRSIGTDLTNKEVLNYINKLNESNERWRALCFDIIKKRKGEDKIKQLENENR